MNRQQVTSALSLTSVRLNSSVNGFQQQKTDLRCSYCLWKKETLKKMPIYRQFFVFSVYCRGYACEEVDILFSELSLAISDWEGWLFPTESSTTTETPDTASVLIELCDVTSFDSCSVCASNVLSDFKVIEFDSEHDLSGETISVSAYSHGVLRCGNSSVTTQNVKISFNTNEIRPTEITMYGKGKCFYLAFLS